jgi:hypothetical protein
MSEDVSARENCRRGLQQDAAYRRRRALDAAWLRRQGNLVRREREPLDCCVRQYSGIDTAAQRHYRCCGRLRRLFGSGVSATAADLHRHDLGISELQVHPVRALAGLNDHLHRSAGSPLSRLPYVAVNEGRRAYACVGRDLGANQRLSKRSAMTGRIFDEIERRF